MMLGVADAYSTIVCDNFPIKMDVPDNFLLFDSKSLKVVNSHGLKELVRAVRCGDDHMVCRQLRENNADPTVFVTRSGMTLLHIATFNAAVADAGSRQEVANCRVMRLLQSSYQGGSYYSDDFEIKQADNEVKMPGGLRVVHIAARSGKQCVLYELTGYGVNLEVIDEEGLQPLHHAIYAAAEGRGGGAARWLLNCGVKPAGAKHKEVMTLLIECFRRLIEREDLAGIEKNKRFLDLCEVAEWLVYYGSNTKTALAAINTYINRTSTNRPFGLLKRSIYAVSSRCSYPAWYLQKSWLGNLYSYAATQCFFRQRWVE